jgi:hypothetical protein
MKTLSGTSLDARPSYGSECPPLLAGRLLFVTKGSPGLRCSGKGHRRAIVLEGLCGSFQYLNDAESVQAARFRFPVVVNALQ